MKKYKIKACGLIVMGLYATGYYFKHPGWSWQTLLALAIMIIFIIDPAFEYWKSHFTKNKKEV